MAKVYAELDERLRKFIVVQPFSSWAPGNPDHGPARGATS